MHQTVKIEKLSDLDSRIAPGFANVWRQIKALTGTKVRAPKHVTVTDAPSPMYPNDYDSAARFAVDLETLTVRSEVHVSAGEWATANRGQERGITDIPAGQAVVSCTWNDYYRTFSLTIEVSPGALKSQIGFCACGALKGDAPADHDLYCAQRGGAR